MGACWTALTEERIVLVQVTSPPQRKQAYLGCLLFALGVDSTSLLLGTLAFDLLQLLRSAVGLSLRLLLLDSRLAQSANRLLRHRFRLNRLSIVVVVIPIDCAPLTVRIVFC